jgi:hypothetical protein
VTSINADRLACISALATCITCVTIGASFAAPSPYEVWGRSISSSEIDFSAGVATDGALSVYVAGYSSGQFAPNPGGGGGDVFIRKFSANGDVTWTRQIGGPGGESATSMIVAPTGDVLVSGRTSGAFGGPNAGSPYDDGFVTRLSSTGTTLWTSQFGTARSDSPIDLAVTASGNIVTAGYSDFGVNYNAFLQAISPTGSPLWSKTLNAPGGVLGLSVDTDGSGNSIIIGEVSGGQQIVGSSETGAVFAAKYDGAGNQLWLRQFGSMNDYTRDIAVDELGNSYIVGSEFRKLDSAGNELWSTPMQAGASISLDAQGRVIVGANLGNDAVYYVFNRDGVYQRTGYLGAPSGAATKVAADSAGHVYAYQSYAVNNFYDTFLYKHQLPTIPEPASAGMLMSACAILAIRRRRRC